MTASTDRRRSVIDALRARLPARRERQADARRRAGWLIVAEKEIGDHVTSARFLVLLLILALAAAVPLYIASGLIRDAAERASGSPALFLALFILGSEDLTILRVSTFIGFLAPLLGIAFGFDAVNGERSEGTLPRLLSQPIHRDDVINGKFAAGLAVISMTLVALVLFIAGAGIVRLGIVPTSQEVVRITIWIAVTILYVGFWLAVGTLLSVVFRRAATSALVGFGVWFTVTLFGGLIAQLVGGLVAPTAGASTAEEFFRNAQLQQLISRLMPSTLYQEVSVVVLNPSVTQVSTPVTLGQLQQAQQQVATLFSLDQSLLLVWPQIVALVALTVVTFALAYVAFMRQEVRA